MNSKPLLLQNSIPVLAEPPHDRSFKSAVLWASENAREIQSLAGSIGVVLIRGFEIQIAEDFRAVCQAIEPDLKTYTGGDSPRTHVTDKIYTSTEYDPSLEVFLHNELSYAGWSPGLVFFGCMLPALKGGETPIADGRQIYKSMPSEILKQFETRGIAYLQHLWDANGKPGIGKSWQETFETTERNAAEAYLRQSNMTWEWTDFGIRTRAQHPAVVHHPLTGEKCWRNQADQWHRHYAGVKTSFGGDGDPRFDPQTAGEETLGNHVTYGDGGEIEVSDLMQVRRVVQAAEVVFPWQAGDIMVIDNILAMHGRKPYEGPRQVLVAMA
ncbi:MAG: alpha-ketoglutarate-dependent taurine dioxygenase [Gammaproteobacteria bacterium]|jgi:alpha-ketoglutarate-dependent taurine dioxygenase